MVENNWSFSDTREWEKVSKWNCTGVEQSPINILTDTVTQCKSLCDAEFKYAPTKCKVNYKNGLLRFFVDKGSYLVFKGVVYELTEITVHTPSLHKIDGEGHDAEICFIHRLSEDGNENGESSDEVGIIVSRLFKKGQHHGDSERFISEVINELPAEPINYNKIISVSKSWGANLLLPEKKGFYMYNGSLPFPPCTEKFVNIVLEDIGNIGETTVEILGKHLGKNVRPLKPIYDREVFYNTGQKSKLKAPQSNTALTDKYLKCVKTQRTFDQKPIEEPPIVDRGSGFSDSLKRKLHNIMLPLTVIVLFIVAVFFTKYLFREIRNPGNPVPSKGGLIKKFFMILTVGKLEPSKWNNWGASATECSVKK